MSDNYFTNRYKMMVHIVHAHDHAKAGYIPQAEDHQKKALSYFDKHKKGLEAIGHTQTAASFHDEMTPYFDKLDKIISEAKKTSEAKKPPLSRFLSRLRRSEVDNMTEEELEKAIMAIPGTKPAKIATKVEVDRQPGRDPRYNYKPFHDLSHEDQVKATHAFQDRDMGNHHYPVDKQTGEFVHGATRWLQPKSAPQATPSSQGVVVAPEHRAGASVRINSEGSPHHGKLGIVKMPNPHFPGKVPVQVGIKDHQVEYFEPGQVKLNKSEEIEPILEDLVSKSRKVLASIKKGPE